MTMRDQETIMSQAEPITVDPNESDKKMNPMEQVQSTFSLRRTWRGSGKVRRTWRVGELQAASCPGDQMFNWLDDEEEES